MRVAVESAIVGSLGYGEASTCSELLAGAGECRSTKAINNPDVEI